MPAATAPPPARRVALKDVEKTIDAQLKELQGADEAPVVRSRMSNLVIYCDNEQTTSEIKALVPAIAEHHPSRVILLADRPGSGLKHIEAVVEAEINAAGRGLRAFSEFVTLETDRGMANRLPFAVRQLLVGDLPINLWWTPKTPPVMAGSLLFELAEDANQVIFDSMGWLEPAKGLAATAAWMDRFERSANLGWLRVTSDLAWRRLKTWRRLVGQAIDPASAPGPLSAITDITFDHGPNTVTSAWTLASWLSRRLGWRVAASKVVAGQEINWEFNSSTGPKRIRIRRLAHAPRGIQWIRVAYALEDKRTVALNLSPADDRRLKIEPENFQAATRTMTIGRESLAELVARQLSDREVDTVFQDAMKITQDLALNVLRVV